MALFQFATFNYHQYMRSGTKNWLARKSPNSMEDFPACHIWLPDAKGPQFMNPFNAKARFRLRGYVALGERISGTSGTSGDWTNEDSMGMTFLWGKRMTGENGHMCENEIAMRAAKMVIIIIWTPTKTNPTSVTSRFWTRWFKHQSENGVYSVYPKNPRVDHFQRQKRTKAYSVIHWPVGKAARQNLVWWKWPRFDLDIVHLDSTVAIAS